MMTSACEFTYWPDPYEMHVVHIAIATQKKINMPSYRSLLWNGGDLFKKISANI